MPDSVRAWLTEHALTKTMIEDAERIANAFPEGDERRENVIRLTYFARGVLQGNEALTPEQMLAFRAERMS